MKSTLYLLLKLLVTGVCLWLLSRSVDWATLGALLSNINLFWVVVAVIIFWIAQIASSLRCAYIALQLGGQLELLTSVRAHFVGLWFNQVLPTSLGGDVVKMAILQKPLGLNLAVRAGILDRLSGLIFMMVAVAVTLPLYANILNNVQLTGLAILVAGFLFALVLAVALAHYLSARLTLHRWLEAFLQLLKDVWAFRKGSALWQQTWTSAIVHFNGIASYALLSLALGLPTDAMQYFLLVPLLFLVALMPVSLAGWGVREVGAVWLFSLVGMPRENALAISVCYGLMLVFSALPGLFLFLKGRKESETVIEQSGN